MQLSPFLRKYYYDVHIKQHQSILVAATRNVGLKLALSLVGYFNKGSIPCILHHYNLKTQFEAALNLLHGNIFLIHSKDAGK